MKIRTFPIHTFCLITREGSVKIIFTISYHKSELVIAVTVEDGEASNTVEALLELERRIIDKVRGGDGIQLSYNMLMLLI